VSAVTKGAGSRTKGLLMAFKLLDMAQQALGATGRRRSPAIGPCRCEVRRWSSETNTNHYSIKRSRTTGSRLIMRARSTTIDNYSELAPLENSCGAFRDDSSRLYSHRILLWFLFSRAALNLAAPLTEELTVYHAECQGWVFRPGRKRWRLGESLACPTRTQVPQSSRHL
jgi:hypothetical protein